MLQPGGHDTRAREITSLLNRRDDDVAAELYPLVYAELQLIAQQQMAREAQGRTLQATALVHEAYLRIEGDAPTTWSSRGHFFGAAARAMRRILVERARARGAAKRGGDRARVPIDEVDVVAEDTVDMLALNEALTALEARDERMARIVELRFFAGLGVADTAAALGVSDRTVKREWNVARAWLRGAMTEGDPDVR